MRLAYWQEGIDKMGRRASSTDHLRDFAVDRLRRGDDVNNADPCRRVPALMAELLDAQVSVRFVNIHVPRLTGGTARRSDGSYIIYCAKSRSKYHRLGILLHELAHVLLEHKPIELNTEASLRRFLPHLPAEMITIIAGRTDLTTMEERAAEELADSILACLTEPALEPHHGELLAGLPDHVQRIADALEDRQEGP